MENTKSYVCYNARSVKLGIIELKSNSTDVRKVFLDNKDIIKKTFPGTAFIKLKPVRPATF